MHKLHVLVWDAIRRSPVINRSHSVATHIGSVTCDQRVSGSRPMLFVAVSTYTSNFEKVYEFIKGLMVCNTVRDYCYAHKISTFEICIWAFQESEVDCLRYPGFCSLPICRKHQEINDYVYFVVNVLVTKIMLWWNVTMIFWRIYGTIYNQIYLSNSILCVDMNIVPLVATWTTKCNEAHKTTNNNPW